MESEAVPSLREPEHSIIETLVAKPPPLRLDESGTLRVGKTRVPLDTVVHAYEDGASPEEIVRRFDTLKLADVYAVVGYYLEHRDEVQAYLERRRQQGEEWQRFWQARCSPEEIRERLLARRKQSE
jgi:uncharacterized protein (DUF433 family)